MKKLLGLTLCIMLTLTIFASSVYATTYNYDSFDAPEGYGSKEKKDNNITNLKGNDTPSGGMYFGPYSKASTAKLTNGIIEETYVEIDLEKLKQGEFFEVSLALKNAENQYVSEAVVMSQMNNNEVVVKAGWAPKLNAVIKESGIYTYQWKMYTEDDNTYVVFKLLKNDETIGTSGIIDFDTIVTDDTKNPIADENDVSVKYLWFCNIQVADGINVYAELPKTEEPTTPEPATPEQTTPEQTTPEEPAEQDDTPKTGTVDIALVASMASLVSLAGIVAVKKYNK